MSALAAEISTLKDSARLLFEQSENLKKLITSINVSTQRSSSASHEISTTVATTAEAAIDLERSAKESFDALNRSVDARKATATMMVEVMSSVEELQISVKNGLSEISSITTTMSQIHEKAKVINEIVFQTKLLSFNASVEAARAGDFGKGFSVVAAEMAKLAQASGLAAKEIEEIITAGIEQTQNQIKNATDNLNRAAEKTSYSSNNLNSRRGEVSQIFSELIEATKLTNEKSQQISAATKEQDLGVKEINNALQNLEVNSVDLEKMADENYISSVKLSELVESITEKIENYSKKNGIEI